MELRPDSIGSTRLDQRTSSLKERGLLNEEEEIREFREVYRYTSEFALPIIHHWVEETLDDFVSNKEDNKYLLFYLRDAYPALQIARTIAEEKGVSSDLIIPVHISRESLKDSRILSYFAHILPKKAVGGKISLWHVDTGVYASIQDELISKLPLPPDQLSHHLCLLEYIKERYSTDLTVRFWGGDIHPYYEPRGNEHILIHLIEGLFNLGPKVTGYEPNSLRPIFDQSNKQTYIWEHASRVAVKNYCDRLSAGEISRIPSGISSELFLESQFNRLEEMVNRWGEETPSVLKRRILTFESYRQRKRRERIKNIISLLKTKEKTYNPITPMSNRKDASFYSLFNSEKNAGLLADYDDLLENFFSSYPKCMIRFDPQKGRLEPVNPISQKEETDLEIINKSVIRVSMFENGNLFNTNEARIRIQQRKIYVLLQSLKNRKITVEQMLSTLGIHNKEEFQAFYRKAMRFWHPDMWSGVGLNEAQRRTILEVAQRLNSVKRKSKF